MTGALLGFALVFVVTAVTGSVLATGTLLVARRRLEARGPLAERRAAELAAVVPLVIAAIAVGALVVQATFGVDHCATHGHHAHLCFQHGAMWMDKPWVAVVVAVTSAAALGRATIAVAAYLRGSRGIRALAAVSVAVDDVQIVASPRAFCFVARRGVFVSSRVWGALPLDERAAVVAHERGHVAHRDLAKRALLEALLVFAVLARPLRAAWLRATERLCDAHAAREVGDPEVVARAMVSMCRLGTQPAPSFAFTPAAAELAARIRAVLARGPMGHRAARSLAWFGIAGCIALAIAGFAAATPIHHAFETLLG